MHLLLSAHGDDRALLDELARRWPWAIPTQERPGLIAVEGDSSEPQPLLPLVFARQLLPHAQRIAAASVRAWAEQTLEAIVDALPLNQPWRLHVAPHYGASIAFDQATRGPRRQRSRRPMRQNAPPPPTTPRIRHAGRRRCELIRATLLQEIKQRRRRLARQLHEEPSPLTPADSLVQLLLTSPESDWLSLSQAPTPHTLRQMVWPFPKGEVPLAVDKAAPSRAFAKLVEAEQRWGRRIEAGETCVDLGASPGSWSYVALQRGARVTAVDRAPLRDDLMRHPHLTFVRGDAFTYEPKQPVNWLLCDVIAAPDRNIALLLDWARRGWAKRFVVTIKFRGREDYPLLDRLQEALPALADEWFLVRLSANRNEACAFGSIAAQAR